MFDQQVLPMDLGLEMRLLDHKMIIKLPLAGRDDQVQGSFRTFFLPKPLAALIGQHQPNLSEAGMKFVLECAESTEIRDECTIGRVICNENGKPFAPFRISAQRQLHLMPQAFYNHHRPSCDVFGVRVVYPDNFAEVNAYLFDLGWLPDCIPVFRRLVQKGELPFPDGNTFENAIKAALFKATHPNIIEPQFILHG